MNTEGELIFCFVIVELFKNLNKSPSLGAVTAVDVQEWIPELEPGDPYFEIETSKIDTALRRCEQQGLLLGYHSDFAKSRYRAIHKNLENFYRMNFAEKDSGVHQVAVLGADWLAEMLRNIRAGSRIEQGEDAGTFDQAPKNQDDAIPASDRYVRIDHNAPTYKHAIVTLQEAIERLEGINEELDVETATKIVEISAGRSLLEGTQVNLHFVDQLLIKGLAFLATKTFGAFVDGAIKSALAAVRTLFVLP